MSIAERVADLAVGLTSSGVEFHGRVRELLARKEEELSRGIERLYAQAGTSLSAEGLRAWLRSCLDRVQGEKAESAAAAGPAGADRDWALLVERIRVAGREGTIENYARHLFTF